MSELNDDFTSILNNYMKQENLTEFVTSIRELSSGGVQKEDLAYVFQIIYELMDMTFNEEYYFFAVHMPRILNGTDNEDLVVDFSANDGISGIALIKDGAEKLISRFYIFDEFDGIHVANVLAQKATEILKTKTPIINLSPEAKKYFKKAAKYYGWDIDHPSIRGYYNDNAAMEIFNQKK